jgi:hypothetical protein
MQFNFQNVLQNNKCSHSIIVIVVLKLVLNFAGNRKYSWGKSRGGGVTFVASVEIGTKFCRKP